MQIIQPVVSYIEKTCSKKKMLINLYTSFYKDVVTREITLANISCQDTVLNIGCGAIPFTAIHLARLTGAKVWAVDRDINAVEGARYSLKLLGLTKKVLVIEGDGSEKIPSGFTAAVVALQAEPKETIFKNLFSLGSPGARLIFRHPSPSYKSFYDQLPEKYCPAAHQKQNMKTFDKSLLFIKNK
ncbi:SAM-dependent methyltransferase [Candidatus Contubernalis alkaliaceticus]|uniref:SAM-dependent methyltransferase n=1 Tax=Candidatus Contubernalis alkaliaceticus TaxID=338645 RepID=UPI001F4C08DB|nr:hypothetical protein [Candidatus Contubernalis alkalaceticus]UNC93009.1 hypothetical protein HUE98_13455 [Candidatus Contubernalis alkalaceticus]